MALDPLTAIITVASQVIDRVFPNPEQKMQAEAAKAQVALETVKLSQDETGAFRQFVLAYEGEASILPKWLLAVRSIIRPAFTILVGYLDFEYFTTSGAWTPEKGQLLYAVNLIVLMFWFGERAVVNSGLMDILKAWATARKAP